MAMSKLNQIQTALKEIGDADFQKLADSYLNRLGYENINALGSVLGSSKTRVGTPDTFLRQENGKLVFAEHTTQEKGLLQKLHSDLENCLNESKTGIAVDEIEQIIFCHNSILSPEEEQSLINKGQENGIDIKIIGISGISFDLNQKYPGLAQDFLGISIDTGQILEKEDFIAKYGKNQLATPLDTVFCFRENELKQISDYLDNYSSVLLSGPPGVGKSRLALKALEDFKNTHNDYEVRCIYNLGPNLFDDLKVHFSQPGKFLILVDDANLISQFSYIIDLIQNQRDDQEIKIIITVRDYASDNILAASKPIGIIPQVILDPLTNNQIKELVQTLYDINNSLYLDRISRISGGNPRLAIMAAKLAVKHKTMESIQDVSSLYDEYYASLKDDLKDLEDEDVLKVAGIISFFRVIDRTNQELMETIKDVFEVNPDEFWDVTKRLHEYEVVDIYEKEVVKINDQVFSTYIFYLCFFKNRIIDFSILMDSFFPSQINRFRDAIYPCLDSFYFQRLKSVMFPHVKRTWEKLIMDKNHEDLYKLIEMFWFMLQTESLNYFSDYIEALEPCDCNIPEIDWSSKSTDTLSIFKLLGLFKNTDSESTFRIALGLAYDYAVKRPSEVTQLLHLLTETFGFGHKSHTRGYIIQTIIVDELLGKLQSGENLLFSALFIQVAKNYLHTHFMSHEPEGNALVIHKVDLLPVEAIFGLRAKIWSCLFLLYDLDYKNEVLSVLKHYSTEGYYVSKKEIIANDSHDVQDFIKCKLDPNDFKTCIVVHSYISKLQSYNIDYDSEIKEIFQNPTYDTYKLLSIDYFDKEEMSMQEFEEFKKEQIKQYTSQYNIADYENFFDHCLEIVKQLDTDHELYNINNGILQVFVSLYERDSSLFVKVIQQYVNSGEQFRFQQPSILVDKLIKICGSKKSLEMIEGADFPTKNSWLSSYYQVVPSEDITSETVKSLYKHYNEAKSYELPWYYDYLQKYVDHDNSVFVNITKIILDRSSNDPGFVRLLTMMFNRTNQNDIPIIKLFEGSLDIFEEAYLALSNSDKMADYDGSVLSQLFSADPNFIVKIINKVYADNKWPQRYDDMRDYAFLWKHDNCKSIMCLAIDRILEWEKERDHISGNYLERLFCIDENKGVPDEIVDKQDVFVAELIQLKCDDLDFMTLLFKPISYFEEGRRRKFISLFLEHNKNFEDFKHLPLEPDSWGYTGSAVPMIQKQIDYWESILQLCDSAELLKHKLKIENHIQSLQAWMEAEKKADFMEDKF